MNKILLSLPAPIALPFRMKSVVENIASTATDAASLPSIYEALWNGTARRLTVQCQN